MYIFIYTLVSIHMPLPLFLSDVSGHSIETVTEIICSTNVLVKKIIIDEQIHRFYCTRFPWFHP